MVGEETLASLLSEQDDGVDRGRARRLVVTARADGGGAELEFVSGFEEETWRTSRRIWEKHRIYGTVVRYRSAC